MSSGKLGRILFRKIGGRIVPIRIKNVSDPIAGASSYANRFRKITANVKGQQVAALTLSLPKKGKTATLVDVRVEKEFRRKGISKNLFARAKQFLERANFKFIRSNELLSPAQVKIRNKIGGTYKAGAKRKSRTKYFADQFGPYGEQTKRVSRQDAIEIIKQNKTPASKGRQVTATTMLNKLPKKYRK